MAREVIIRILDETADVPSADASAQQSAQPDSSASSRGSRSSRTVGDLLKVYVARKLWNIAKNEAKYFTGKYFNATENYKAQLYEDNIVDTIDFGVSVATSAIAGAKFASSAGVAGPVGAAIAVAGVVLQKAASSFNSVYDEAQRLVANTYGNYFYGERSGYVSGGHGTEN